MMTSSPGFIVLIAPTAAGLRTPSHSVVLSRLRSSSEYVSGSVFARKYAIAATSMFAGGTDYRTLVGSRHAEGRGRKLRPALAVRLVLRPAFSGRLCRAIGC